MVSYGAVQLGRTSYILLISLAGSPWIHPIPFIESILFNRIELCPVGQVQLLTEHLILKIPIQITSQNIYTYSLEPTATYVCSVVVVC